MGKEEGPVTAIWPGSRLHYFECLREVRWEDYDINYWKGDGKGKGGNRFAFMGNGYTETELGEGDPVWYFDDPFVKV